MIQLLSTIIALCICGVMIVVPTILVFYFVHIIFKKLHLIPSKATNSNNKINTSVPRRNNNNSDVIRVNLNNTFFNYSQKKDENQWNDVLQRVNFAEEQKKWIKMLYIPYKRYSLESKQCEDEIIKLYSNIAIFTDQYLKTRKTNLDELVKKLNTQWDHYNNILYTFECIAEGEVEMHYKGGLGYDNNFSYRLINKHLGEEFTAELKKYITQKLILIEPPTQETIRVLRLSENGMPYLSWDVSGKIRSDMGIHKDDYKWISYLPLRETQFLKIEQCKLETIKLYLRCIRSLEEMSKNSQTLSKSAQRTLNKLFFGKLRYGESNYAMLEALHKLSEYQVRKAYPASRLINVDKETEFIIKKFGNENSKLVFELISKQAESISPPSSETLTELFSNNPFGWRAEIGALGKKLTQDNYLEIYSEAKKIVNKYETFESIVKVYFELGVIFVPINRIISLYFFYKYKSNKSLAKDNNLNQTITTVTSEIKVAKSEDTKLSLTDKNEIPQKFAKLLFKDKKDAQKFYELVNLGLTDEKALEEIKLIFVPKRKTIDIDFEKAKVISKEHKITVGKLGEFLGEDNTLEAKDKIVSKSTSTTFQEVFSDIKSQPTELLFNPIQISLINLIVKKNLRISKTELNLFAKENNLFANSLLSNINQIFYNIYEDQLLTEDGEDCYIEESYIPTIKKYL